jgi:hypothetical protein
VELFLHSECDANHSSPSIPDSSMFERLGEHYNDREGQSVEWERAVIRTEHFTEYFYYF